MNSHGVKAPDCYHSTMALTLFTLNYTHLELMLGTSKLPAVGNTSSNPKNKMLKSLTKFFIMFSCILICEVFAEATSIIIPYHLMCNYNCTKRLLALEVFSNSYLFLRLIAYYQPIFYLLPISVQSG